MPAETHRRFTARSGGRRVLRAAVALGAATMMLGGIGIPTASADPVLPLPGSLRLLVAG